ncbi:MAG: tyrosine-type recombinase/integrase [Lachnospiraceae bacterium]|nr:tyrosine-type recombinase/integrase [Lachnospiraceae bacterium]
MPAKRNYHDQQIVDNNLKLRDMLKNLPSFAADYFRAIETTTSSRTRIAYAYDLTVFFRFLKENNPLLKDLNIHDLRLDILDQITARDIEEYLDYLKVYYSGNKKDDEPVEHTNQTQAIKRKLSSLRSFYRYFYMREDIHTNPTLLVEVPKLREKEIIRLDVDEVARLLDEVESGENLTERQKKFHEKTKMRDLTIMTLLLGTGMRVSECVGIDIQDIDPNNYAVKIRRKGGYEFIVYLSDEVYHVIEKYMIQRKKMKPVAGHEDALFLSLQNKRINVRTVENLVKKYAQLVTTMKHITPHKLRSTYGTNLYRETGDIYLVADMLGHKDVNTTKKHYAATDEERRRAHRNDLRLREDEDDN